jgi:hypothetical protein
MTSITALDCQSNMDNGVANILAVLAQATPTEYRKGLAWYADAKNDAIRISELYGVPLLTVVKVACALSPRLTWEDNMPAAESVIRHYVSSGYVPDITPYVEGAIKLQRTHHDMDSAVIADDSRIPSIKGPTKVNIVKALWILQGHEWVLRGPKVQSFLDNIMEWETSDAVTVDSHAIQVWFGRMEPGTYSVPNAWYKVVAADYRKAAGIANMTPLQLQAITWLTKKRLSPRRRSASAIVNAVEKMLA